MSVGLADSKLTLYHTTFCSDWSKLKAFTDDKIYVTEKFKLLLGTVGNIVGKGVNVGYHHFFPFPTMFSNSFFFQGCLKWSMCSKGLNVALIMAVVY